MTRRVPAASLVVLLTVSVPALAQHTYRQTVVVTASATPVPLGSVTRRMTIITREQIAALPAHDVADLLRLTGSIDVRARGPRGVQTDFAVRGAGFGQMLVLVDGVRLNDAQSGHHNGDIPVPLDAVERIEVLYGPGSSLFGADAFGGTVNIITRRAARPSARVLAGSFGLAGASAQAAARTGAGAQLFSGLVERSGGFVEGRDYETAVARWGLSVGSRSSLSVAYQWKAFGARNFYGAAATGDAMSREWTNQTLVAADHGFGAVRGWSIDGGASYRTHGDRFLFDERTASAANRHRTHEALGSLVTSRDAGRAGRFTIGVQGGATWIGSTNLGDHDVSRVSGFGEWRRAVGARTQVDAGMRVDRYSEFGASWSPAAGIGFWPTPALRLRASAGRAFRVPTFTERFYTDRNHRARSEVTAEHSWSGEAGVDVFLPGGWIVEATGFRRADTDLIDWICADQTCGTAGATERWRTHNIHDVTTAGFELGVRRTVGAAFLHAEYSQLAVDAPALRQRSKYLLDYAPRSFVAGASVPVARGWRAAPRVQYRRRRQMSGSREYVLLDGRVTRRAGPALELFVEASNLLNARYEEIPGVIMPGRAVALGLSVGAR